MTEQQLSYVEMLENVETMMQNDSVDRFLMETHAQLKKCQDLWFSAQRDFNKAGMPSSERIAVATRTYSYDFLLVWISLTVGVSNMYSFVSFNFVWSMIFCYVNTLKWLVNSCYLSKIVLIFGILRDSMLFIVLHVKIVSENAY